MSLPVAHDPSYVVSLGLGQVLRGSYAPLPPPASQAPIDAIFAYDITSGLMTSLPVCVDHFPDGPLPSCQIS